MNTKYIKIITSLFILIAFFFTTVPPAPDYASAAKGDKSSPYVSKKSKLKIKKSSKKKKIKTYTYKQVKSRGKKTVPTATGPVKFKVDLTESIPKIGADYTQSLNYSGQDVYVVVIDTGIEKAHPFFQDRVKLEACFAMICPNNSNTMIGPGAAAPVHYHGTHVSGIVGGYASNISGVAPKVNIIAINVFDRYGGAYDADIIRALNYVYTLADTYNIASVNMSLGGSRIFKEFCDTYIPEMTDAIYKLKQKNIATVVASGNSYAVGMSAPACISHAVSVAATATSTDKVTDFSNVSRVTTLSAPGLQIVSSALMGSYRSASGTSMAAPHVAGAFAVYRSKYGVQSVDKVVADFQLYSSPAIDDYSQIVTKRIDLKKLFTGNSSQPPVTSTTSTTLPAPVVTTTTVPVTTTTVSPSPPSPTTTIPTTNEFGKPRLTSLYTYSSNWRSYTYDVFMVTYIDVNYGKRNLTHYLLTCDNGSTYTIPLDTSGSLHSYRLKNSDETFASSVGIKSCYLQGARNDYLGPSTWPLNVTK
jgi:subtilisin family serine protease